MFIPKPLIATILNSAASGAGDAYNVIQFTYKTCVITFTGSGATTVVIEISNDGSNYVTAKNSDGTDAVFTADGYFESDTPFKYIHANISVAGGKTVKVDLCANR